MQRTVNRQPPAEWLLPDWTRIVACPYCRVAAGEPCRTRLGEQVGSHWSRVERAARARRADVAAG